MIVTSYVIAQKSMFLGKVLFSKYKNILTKTHFSSVLQTKTLTAHFIFCAVNFDCLEINAQVIFVFHSELQVAMCRLL